MTQAYSPMRFTDSHCHLDFDEFSNDFSSLMADCKKRGIHRLIVPAIGPDNWVKVLKLDEKMSVLTPQIYNALGIHPWWVEDCDDHAITQLSDLVSQHKSKLIAIGEIGIDGALKNHVSDQAQNLTKQINFFERQLDIASANQLPVIVHHRKSHPQLQSILKQKQFPLGGIIHGFSGSYEQAKGYIEFGFKLGIGGTITYERAKKTRNALKRLPLECLVLETDAPAMPLNGFQGQPNSPLRLINVFKELCSLLSTDAEKLAVQLEKNIDEVFFN